MARPLEQSGPVSLLEDAAHLLRRASLDALLCHWTGSVPFALMALVFWHNLTHPPMSDLDCAAESLAVALLLIWMNCWRGVFAARLCRMLAGAAERPWNGRRVWRLVAAQAFLAASKPAMLCVSLAAVFPFATTVAFYRNAAALAGRGDLDPLAAIAEARRLARGEGLPCWLLQFLMLLLSAIVMLNVAVTFAVLPELVRMLTGYDSAFSGGGPAFIESRLFLALVLAATWVLFDPFVQAVYCLRCFQAESAETGEDLRAALRLLPPAITKGAAAIVVALALPVVAARAADSVGSRELERAVRRTMQSPEYNWRIPPPPTASSAVPWIVEATDRAIAAVRSALDWAGRMIDRLLRWIFGGLGLSPMPLGGQAPSTALHWSVWALIGLALALAGWVVWRAFRLRRESPGRQPVLPLCPYAWTTKTSTPTACPKRLAETAERCLADGDLRLALRAFYLANLAWLGRREFLIVSPGKTNREFEVELRRRARQSPEARELFSANVRAFESAWYGLHDVFEEDALAFRRRGDEIRTLLGAGGAA